MQDTTVYRKDYKPSSFTAVTVSLNFDLYDSHALVTNCMQLQRQHPGELCLYGSGLELHSLTLNEQLLSPDAYRFENGNLWIADCPDEATLTVVTRILPQENTSLSGLYRSNQLFCTQCEAEGFRRITYFLDRPDVLATYTTRISADKKRYPILLSNGNLRESGETDDGRHWVVWHDPFKKPSYLFALVAGDLACVSDTFVTGSGRTVDLHIYVEPGNEDKCAHAMVSLKKAMRWDETMFGREYDLNIYMVVAVGDFNMGAMENKGLNIFNSKYVLARPDTATDQDYADIEGVIGHEYFHNWTGNRVTCRDWFQLSLKEGLTVFRDQEFSRDMNSRDVNRIQDVRVLRNAQFPEDAGSMAHPVRPESFQEINNFYTATIYNKGAEVIRMQQTLLGKAGFRRGMDLYFKRHDGKAVTIDDFVAAMEDANQVDLTQFKRWYSQAGTPRVAVQSEYQGGTLTIKCTQSCAPTPECKDKKPFHIPIRIALFKANGEPIVIEKEILELREIEQTFCFEHLPEKPILSLLRDFSAPVILDRQKDPQELLALLRFDNDGFSKWDAAQRLALDCIIDCYHAPRHEWKISEALIGAYRHVLTDDALDAALRADLLMPPGFEEVASQLKDIDVAQVEAVRDFFRATLGAALFEEAHARYLRLWAEEDHAMNGHAYSRRALRNRCLWLMMKGNEAKALSLCQQQFSKARTMTDQITSFGLLVNSTQSQLCQQAIDDFYQQWQKEDLVLDKWFAIQATCDKPGTLAAVKQLMSHRAFNIKNPNKVRALVGAFTQSNVRHFHALDGSGYAFLGDILIQMDKINPQIAARLATPFTRMKRLNDARQVLMKQQLERLATSQLSGDLSELVTKSLAL